GANTVARTASIEVREPTVCATTSGTQCAVDLSHDRNHDGTATVAASAEGNFDGSGWSYDAALMPPSGTFVHNGVNYAAPDPSGTPSNFVEARGQSLLLPAGKHQAVQLIGSSHNGPVSTSLAVHYSDGSSADLPVTFGDWAGSTPSGTTVVLDMAHRIKAGS